MIHAHIKALSKDRITSYTKATLGNNKLAIDLYEKNIQLSKYEFEYIGRFELILRNKINTLLTSRINNNWYRDHWINDLNTKEEIRRFIDKAKEKNERKFRKRNGYKNGDIVSSLTFGVWKEFFNKNPYEKIKSRYNFEPKEIYIDGETLNRKDIFNDLKMITDLRNRIAHHETIVIMTRDINSKKKKIIDTSLIVSINSKIDFYLSRMDIERDKVKVQIDSNVPALISSIDAIKEETQK